MRYLGLDIGERRIGIAVSDPEGRVATPLKVIAPASPEQARSLLARTVEEYEPDAIVVGVPVTLSGEDGPQARWTRDTGERLSRDLGVPVRYWDERLTSAEARRLMAEGGLSQKEMRGRIDMVAAALVLQSFLDAGGGSR